MGSSVNSTVSRELKRNIPKRGRTAGRCIARHAKSKTYHRHAGKAKQVLLNKYLKLRIKGRWKIE
jgi:IS30 family transposase